MDNNSNSSTSSSVNEFGESDQIYVYTVWVTIIQQILSLFGIALNSALVYITIKHKKLHRSFGFMLAICSLCDALTELATPLATVIRSDQNNTNNSSQSQVEITRRIFKSLAVIMTVTFCLWFLSALITIILAQGLITSNPSLQFLIIRLAAQMITIAGAINAPILYLRNSEYREIIKNEFTWINFLLCSNNHIPIVIVSAGPQILHSSNNQMLNN
ncbi:hypothetical protein niasHT_010970 [Heterodera trifolii]|uniref:G-protein coupled receptors family 1 profile domain-containing protein n=1 Tax=Heterodera trifolii TaxID=157864 RepID=A0ABD2LG25_9BILA